MKKLIYALATVAMMTFFVPSTVHAENTVKTLPYTLNTTIIETVERENVKFTFSIPRSGRITMKLGFFEGSGSSWGYHGDATLYTEDGVKVGKGIGVRDRTGDTDYGMETLDITGGDYYIYVGSNGTSKYELSTVFEDSHETVPDTIHGRHNSEGTAINLPFGQAVTGHLANNGSMDMYTFTLKKAQIVDLKFSNRTNGLRIGIYNGVNTVDRSDTIEGAEGNYKLFCPPGKYYLRVEQRSLFGVYSIKATKTDLPVSKISGTTIKKVNQSVWNSKKGRYEKKLAYRNMVVKFALRSRDYVKGYQIQYATSKDFKKGKKTVDFENTEYLSSKYTINIGKKTGTYYVRIRTYATDNRGNKYCSAWSKARVVNVK